MLINLRSVMHANARSIFIQNYYFHKITAAILWPVTKSFITRFFCTFSP